MLGENYLTADLYDSNAMVKMDITDIHYSDESFDIIICSHVLEHVEDDKKALKELFRVLKKNGWAIILVPITSDKTFEDLTIKTEEDRLKVFGQKDHVRRYGPDYIERLYEAGFFVKITKVEQLVSFDDAQKMGLTDASDDIYFCTKNLTVREQRDQNKNKSINLR